MKTFSALLTFTLLCMVLPLGVFAKKVEPVPAAKTEKKQPAQTANKQPVPAPQTTNDQPAQIDGEAYQLMLLQHLAAINDSLKYTTGEVMLGENQIKIKVPKGFKFLDAASSRAVLEDLWGNPANPSVLGMLFPENMRAIDDAVWAFVINYEEVGHVEDGDAEDINYDELLADMKKETAAENVTREKDGYPAMTLVGWADEPHYDASHKALHWAKEIGFSGEEESSLNYNIRVLGRKGILVLNAAASMSDLNKIKPHISRIIESVTFTAGNQYSDFNPKVDKVATWTIGGLVAGKILAKAGLFAGIAKFAKFIFVGIAAAAVALWLWIRRR